MSFDAIRCAFKYARLTLIHKYYVFCVGRRLRISYGRLAMHDMSKFLPSELFGYGTHFFGKRGSEFSVVWLRHQNRNEHHWEYWIPRSTHSKDGCKSLPCAPLVMPVAAVREMVADWVGASLAYTGHSDISVWLRANIGKMTLHVRTVDRIVDALYMLGYNQTQINHMLEPLKRP